MCARLGFSFAGERLNKGQLQLKSDFTVNNLTLYFSNLTDILISYKIHVTCK